MRGNPTARDVLSEEKFTTGLSAAGQPLDGTRAVAGADMTSVTFTANLPILRRPRTKKPATSRTGWPDSEEEMNANDQKRYVNRSQNVFAVYGRYR